MQIQTINIHNSNIFIPTSENWIKCKGKCGLFKPITDFYQRCSMCKQCKKEANKEYTERNKQMNASRIIDRSGVKLCGRCGEYWNRTHFSIDQLKPDGLDGTCKCCRTRTDDRKLPFEISDEQFHLLLDMPCVWCNDYDNDISRSVDRFDPEQGYIATNVVPSCSRDNKGRSSMKMKEWLQEWKCRKLYGGQNYKPYGITLDEQNNLLDPPLLSAENFHLNIKEEDEL